MSYHDKDNHKDDAPLHHAQAMPIRHPDTVYEYRSNRPGPLRLLAYVSVVCLLSCAAWIVLSMATSLVPRLTAILAIVIGVALGLPIAWFFDNEERKNRQATLRSIKTSR